MDLNEATIDDIRELRPDLYQEIVEDVLMGTFAGRSDEVYGIVLPAINEMRREIAETTEVLRHSLESIVEKEARSRFKKLIQDIEKATVKRNVLLEKQKKAITEDTITSLEKIDVSAKQKSRPATVKPKAHEHTTGASCSEEKTTDPIKVGDTVMFYERQLEVVDVYRKYGIRRLVVKDKLGETFTIKDYEVIRD